MKNEPIFYPAIFHPETVGYSVSVPDIDGCFSEGDTLAQAMEMITDAIGLCLEACAEIPVASNPAKIKVDSGDFIALVAFDLFAYRKKNDTRAVKKTLTIPSWLDAAAQAQHINFSSVLQAGLKQQLHVE